VHAREPDPGVGGEAMKTSCSGVAVHSGASGVEQDGPGQSAVDRPVHGSSHGRRQRHQDNFGAFADHSQHSVSVFFAEVGHVGAGGWWSRSGRTAPLGAKPGRYRPSDELLAFLEGL